jgi:hypothetical protein
MAWISVGVKLAENASGFFWAAFADEPDVCQFCGCQAPVCVLPSWGFWTKPDAENDEPWAEHLEPQRKAPIEIAVMRKMDIRPIDCTSRNYGSLVVSVVGVYANDAD